MTRNMPNGASPPPLPRSACHPSRIFAAPVRWGAAENPGAVGLPRVRPHVGIVNGGAAGDSGRFPGETFAASPPAPVERRIVGNRRKRYDAPHRCRGQRGFMGVGVKMSRYLWLMAGVVVAVGPLAWAQVDLRTITAPARAETPAAALTLPASASAPATAVAARMRPVGTRSARVDRSSLRGVLRRSWRPIAPGTCAHCGRVWRSRMPRKPTRSTW